MFERETRREKILEARNKEIRLKEKTKGILGLGGGGGAGGTFNSNLILIVILQFWSQKGAVCILYQKWYKSKDFSSEV